MVDLFLVDTCDLPEETPADPSPVMTDSRTDLKPGTLAFYWRQKYDELRDESTSATIRSLRTQLRSIKQIASDGEPDALKRILAHVAIALEISR